MTKYEIVSHTIVSIFALAGICYIAEIVSRMGMDGKVFAAAMAIISGIGGYNIVSAIRGTRSKNNGTG